MTKYIFGIFILLVGVYFLFENLGYDIGLGDLFNTYWPVIIIIWGVKILFSGLYSLFAGLNKKRFQAGNLLWGIIVTGVGLVLLGNKLEWFNINLYDLWNLIWPLFIIYLGLNILFLNTWKRKREIFIEFDSNKKKVSFNRKKLYIGETKYGHTGSWHLEDIVIWHGIGEVYINLATAIIPEREVIIDITGLVGEITVLVPQGLAIKANVDVRIGEVNLFNNKEGGAGRFVSYITEDYDLAEKKVNLMISHSVGEINVKQVD